MNDQIPASFEYEGKKYEGYLAGVHGAGVNVWHLYLNGSYCYGRLRCPLPGKWIFDTNDKSKGWESLADIFGEIVIAWYQ